MGLFVAWALFDMVDDVEGDGTWVYPMGIFVEWFLFEMDVTDLESEEPTSEVSNGMNVIQEEGALGIEATTPSSARHPEPGTSGHEGKTAETRMSTIWEIEDEPRMRSTSMASRGSTSPVPTVSLEDDDYDADDEEADFGTKRDRYIERNGQETTRTTTTDQCDGCGEVQLCFKGYGTRMNGKKAWVISLCEGCGGRSRHEESDAEHEDDERSSDSDSGCRSPYDRSRSPSPRQ
jgi:hypothetical protein